MRRRFARHGAIFAAFAVIAACGHSPATTMLTLDAVAPDGGAVQGYYRGPPIAVPAVHVPAELDHAEYAGPAAAGTLKLDDFAHWNAPLGTLARDALVRDLTARLPEGAVLPPAASAGPAARTLDVTILAFRPGPGTAILQVAFRFVPDGPVHQAELKTSVAAADPASGARALSDLIASLADRIVAQLAAGSQDSRR